MKVACIVWEDHYDCEHEWFSAEEVTDQLGSVLITSVGFVAYEDDDKIVLARDADLIEDETCANLVIVKSCVKMYEVLMEVECDECDGDDAPLETD